MEEQKVTTFGKVLKQERERLGLTQTQLAERMKTTQQNIGHWESGRSLPKHDAYEKLLEVFGTDSLLSHLPPRGQINVGPAGGFTKTRELMVDVVSPDGTSAKIEAVQAWADGATAAQRNQRMEVEVTEALPAHLRHNVERKIDLHGITYRPDYLSDKVCAEVRYVTGNRVDVVSRTGMQQLLLFKNILTAQGKAPAQTLLILVAGDMMQVVSNAALKMHAEARALGVDLVYCNTPQAAASTIAQCESGRFPTEVEEEDY